MIRCKKILFSLFSNLIGKNRIHVVVHDDAVLEQLGKIAYLGHRKLKKEGVREQREWSVSEIS